MKVKVKMLITESFPTLRPNELKPAQFLCPCNFPGKNTGVGYNFLLQGILPTQGSNSGLNQIMGTA